MSNEMHLHPIFRLKPITRAIWNIYGPPPLAIELYKQAYGEVIEQMRVATKRRK